MLHKHRAVIDVGNEKVKFSENSTVLFATGDFPPVTSDVRCEKTFAIDGSSEVILFHHQPTSLRSCTRDSTAHAQPSCIVHGCSLAHAEI